MSSNGTWTKILQNFRRGPVWVPRGMGTWLVWVHQGWFWVHQGWFGPSHGPLLDQEMGQEMGQERSTRGPRDGPREGRKFFVENAADGMFSSNGSCRPTVLCKCGYLSLAKFWRWAVGGLRPPTAHRQNLSALNPITSMGKGIQTRAGLRSLIAKWEQLCKMRA